MTSNSIVKSKSANYVASVVAAYWVISISMVYLNKVGREGSMNERTTPMPVPNQPTHPPTNQPLRLHKPSQVLMTNEELSIPAPLFVTWFQCLFTVGLCYLCGELGELQRKKVRPPLSSGRTDMA